MKVPGSVRDAFQRSLDARQELRTRVTQLLNGRKQERWHYESRLKELESYALKLETGRVRDPLQMEDFFACTLVVPNHAAVAKARALVTEIFDVKQVRPRELDRTWKDPSNFPFDDLRMYVEWRQVAGAPKVPFAGVRFEVQIKTFLQHAWAIATHDLVYKANRFSWPQQRIAFEIKAMLEHAEVSIDRAEDLAKTDLVALDTNEFARLQSIVTFLEKQWPAPALPSDRCRLATTIAAMLERLEIGLSILEESLVEETKAGRGTATLNLSPYGILTQSLLNQKPQIFDKLATKRPRDEFKLFVPRELDGFDDVRKKAPTRIVAL